MKIYLASKFELFPFREFIINTFSTDEIQIVDPIKEFYASGLEIRSDFIVEKDKKLIKECDILLAYIETLSFGTTMEIIFAYENKIPVYTITNEKYFEDYWLKYHTEKFFYNCQDFFDFIQNKYKTNKIGGMNMTEFPEGQFMVEHSIKSKTIDEKSPLGIESSIKGRTLEGGRMGIFDDGVNTNLISKNWSPAIIRKYNVVKGWPMYIGMICDENLSDLDIVVNKAVDNFYLAGLINNDIQNMRNLTGYVSESIANYYNSKKKNCVEGIAILLYVDKLAVQNLYGDYMNHGQCKLEFYQTLNMMTQI